MIRNTSRSQKLYNICTMSTKLDRTESFNICKNEEPIGFPHRNIEEESGNISLVSPAPQEERQAVETISHSGQTELQHHAMLRGPKTFPHKPTLRMERL